MSEQGMKIMDIDIQNFKNIEKKSVKIDGHSLVILGKNGAGKSSFIQAILSPLDSQYIPAQPIMQGEESAKIKLKIAGELFGEAKEYELTLFFSEANQTGRLVVTNQLGEQVKSPKSIIKSLLGNIGFDIFEFLRSTPLKQVQVLKELAGVNFDELDMKRKETYDKRTYVNKRIDEEELLLKSNTYTEEQLDKYSKPLDTSDLKSQMANVSKLMEDYVKVQVGIRDRTNDNKKHNDTIDSLEQKIREYEEEIIKMGEAIEICKTHISNNDKDLDKGNKWMLSNSKPSANDIQAQLDVADTHNEHHHKVNAYARKFQDLQKLKNDSKDLTDAIGGIDQQKSDLIKNSNLPVPGLSFDEKQIYLDGLEFNENQINKSRIIKVGFMIAAAMNPNLRVIVINDGSLLDKEQLIEVIKLAEEYNCQVIIEKVLEEGGSLEVQFTEQFLK